MARRNGVGRALARPLGGSDPLIGDYVLSSVVGGIAAWTTSVTVSGKMGEFAERHRAAIVSTAGLLASTLFFILRRSSRRRRR